MQVHRRDISDILPGLPRLARLDLSVPPDVFICTAGFEDRTCKVFGEYLRSGLLADTTLIVVRYTTNEEANQKNLNLLTDPGNRVRHVEQIPYERRTFGEAMRRALTKVCAPGSKTVADVSTCSSFVFYPLVHELFERTTDLTIAYCEAEKYFPELDEWTAIAGRADSEGVLFKESFENAGFQSVGVDDTYALTPFSEMNPGNRPTCLVLFPNFSPLRLNAMRARDGEVNKTLSDNIFWFIGDPPDPGKKWRRDAVLRTNLLDNIPGSRKTFVSTLDYQQTITALEDVWLQTKYQFHMSIGTLGSKMQHLGTYLFLMLHPDVGLWVAEPTRFNAGRYSSGVGKTWCVPFGDTAGVKKQMANYLAYKWQLA